MANEIEVNNTTTIETDDEHEKNGFEKWFKSHSEIDLADAIVGDSCIDWSDNRIVVAAKNSAIICEIGSLRKPVLGRPSNINFSLENVFSKAAVDNVIDAQIHREMEHFNQARLKSSNIAACPNFEAYSVLLNPALPDAKTISYKGFKSVESLPCDGISNPYFATLSLDHICKLYKLERNIYTGVKWVMCGDISKLLVDHISTNIAHIENDPDSSMLQRAMHKKLSTCITTISWSNITSLECGQMVALLATCTQNGIVAIWKIRPCELSNPEISMLHIMRTDMADIASVSFRNANSSMFSIAIGGHSGKIYGYMFICEGDNECKLLKYNAIWNLRDRLAVKKLRWLHLDEGNSLLIGCKSHVIFAFKLDKELKVIDKAFACEGCHELPIKDICFRNKSNDIEFYSCSENGMIIVTNVIHEPSLTLNCSIFSSPNEHEHNQLSKVLHGIKLSANNAFLACVTSKPKIVSSVQIKSTGLLSCRRIMLPTDAARLLIDAANCEQSLCDFLDLFEIHRQYYMINQKFVNALEEILTRETDLVNLTIAQLQFRWFLWKIKALTIPPDVARNTFASFDNEAKVEKQMTTELSKIEICLLFRRMILVLQKWSDSTKTGAPPLNEVLPIYDIITWVKNKSYFLNERHWQLIQEIETLYDLGSPQTCSVSFTKTQFDETGRFGVSQNGSKWPLCCLTFQLIQSPAKRNCKLSGLCATTKQGVHSELMNDLLNGNCIFSGLPML